MVAASAGIEAGASVEAVVASVAGQEVVPCSAEDLVRCAAIIISIIAPGDDSQLLKQPPPEYT